MVYSLASLEPPADNWNKRRKRAKKQTTKHICPILENERERSFASAGKASKYIAHLISPNLLIVQQSVRNVSTSLKEGTAQKKFSARAVIFFYNRLCIFLSLAEETFVS